MAEHLVIVDHRQDFTDGIDGLQVVLAKDYLADPRRNRNRGVRIINLCRSYRYLSEGYYCSLLAEARRQRVIPSVRTITDLSRKSIYSLGFSDIDPRLQRLSRDLNGETDGDSIELLLCFGKCRDESLQDFTRQLFELLPCPILKVTFKFKQQWQIDQVKAVALNTLDEEQRRFFNSALQQHLSKRWRSPRQKNSARYDVAILHNPAEILPPSNIAALRKFIETGRRLGLEVELIQQRDYNRLGEYDALFIRETTGIDHYTYRFAKKAEAEGLVVIDDPDSILKCTNKVYLTELLQANRVPVPKTIILHRNDDAGRLATIGYPVVLKIPDGSFSRGIYKAENPQEVAEYCRTLFRDSDLILAQEYIYTEFDWRIGILNKQPLFACQYFMSKSHWQIVRHDTAGAVSEGAYQAWRLEDVPTGIIDTALRAANLIGGGFYGVDIKQTSKSIVVMEVNDNPNVETGVEDGVLGKVLYEKIMGEFLRRLEKRTARLQEDVP